MCSLCFYFFKKSQKKALMSMKGCKQPLWKQRHQMLLMMKREATGDAGPAASCSPAPRHGGRKASECANKPPGAIKRQLRIQMKGMRWPYHRCGNAFHFLPQSQLQVSWNKKGGRSYPHTMSEFHHISSFTLRPPYFLFQRHNKRGADLIIP